MQPLSLPPPPEERHPAPPSVLSFLVPVAGSLVLWAVTGSASSLVFAALGPLLLVAGMLDGRWRLRRERRRDDRQYQARLRELEELIGERHEQERQLAALRTPSIRALAAQPDWAARERTAPGEPLHATLGRGATQSALRLLPERSGAERPAVERLRETARVLPDAPLPVDLRLGVCVTGNGPAADALLRSVLLQALIRMTPAARLQLRGAPAPWVAALPHEVRTTPRDSGGEAGFVLDDGGTPARVLRRTDAPWPLDCDTVVRVGADGGRVLRHPDLPPGTRFAPDTVTAMEALHLARALAAAAPDAASWIPARVALGPLLAGSPLADGMPERGGLSCPVGVGPGGTIELDLAGDGPHAILGGTTGSGKSELLRSWVLSLASRRPPGEVQFLLLDFKGGASFSALAGLPHTVGVLTDLDGAAAHRAVQSLRAELRHRERTLAAAGLRAVEDGDSGLPRLVVVLDEFAALAEQLPECHAVLADVAARGRSLGVHLILCTQRPAGVVRGALLANAGLRICLRVTSDEDSRAVVGVPDAARLRRPGHAVLVLPGSPPVAVQCAEAEQTLPVEIAGRWPAVPIRRPWLPELPERIASADLPVGSGLVFGLADRPEEQSQPPASWDAGRSGGLLVLGGPRSGRSTALAAVAAAVGAPPAIWPRPTLPCVWDAVSAALDRLDEGERDPRLLLLDDIDAVLAAGGSEYGHELAERLLRVLRDGARSGIAVAMTAARLPSVLSGATALLGRRLLLRSASRDEHLLAGGTPSLFDRSAPPGRGELDGFVVQVADARRESVPPSEESVALGPIASILPGGLLAVTTRPAALEAAFGAGSVQTLDPHDPSASTPVAGTVLAGTVDEWQGRWGVLRQLAATRPVLFDGCGPAEVRSLLGRQELPPPCSGRPRWLIRPGEPAVRARL